MECLLFIIEKTLYTDSCVKCRKKNKLKINRQNRLKNRDNMLVILIFLILTLIFPPFSSHSTQL